MGSTHPQQVFRQQRGLAGSWTHFRFGEEDGALEGDSRCTESTISAEELE